MVQTQHPLRVSAGKQKKDQNQDLRDNPEGPFINLRHAQLGISHNKLDLTAYQPTRL